MSDRVAGLHELWVYTMVCCGREVGRGTLVNSRPPQFEMMHPCECVPAPDASRAVRRLESREVVW